METEEAHDGGWLCLLSGVRVMLGMGSGLEEIGEGSYVYHGKSTEVKK